MANQIQNILHSTLGDGARSTKFECMIIINKDSLRSQISDQDLVYHVKTSQFPGKSNEVIDLKFKGRTIPIKGQVKYDNTWSCTFYLDENHILKKSFEDWIESLDQVHNMSRNLDESVLKAQKDESSYATSMSIIQKDFHGDTDKSKYTLYNVFPKSVSSVDTDYSSVGTILEYTVEFSYSHYDHVIVNDTESEKSEVSKMIDSIKQEANNSAQILEETIKKRLISGSSNKETTAETMLHKR